jgi:hypothetical protein
LLLAEDSPLATFPATSIVAIVRETVSFLRDAKPDVFTFSSQMEHALHTIGHAFALGVASNQLEVGFLLADLFAFFSCFVVSR